MTKAKAIYRWWLKLPLWARIPLALVLLVALVVLAIEGVARAFKPAAPASPYRAIVEGELAQSGRSSATLKEAMAKADKRYAEIERELSNDKETLQEFEAAIAACDSVDAVDDLLAERIKSGRSGAKGKD